MKWYFNAFLPIFLVSCFSPAKIKIEEFRTTDRITYHAFMVEDFTIDIAKAKPTQLTSVAAAFPYREDINRGEALPELIDETIKLEALVLNGERQDIHQSKVQYQRAFVLKSGDWWVVQTAFTSKASGYTFADDLIGWDCESAYSLGYESKDMGWYELGGAQIHTQVKEAKIQQPDGWVVLSK